MNPMPGYFYLAIILIAWAMSWWDRPQFKFVTHTYSYEKGKLGVCLYDIGDRYTFTAYECERPGGIPRAREVECQIYRIRDLGTGWMLYGSERVRI